MTKMLASVKNLQEAKIVLSENIDIIDLKQPEFGALGALPFELITEIVTEIDNRCLVSATIGDLPMDANILFDAVCAMSKTNVDFIKIGFFPDGNWLEIVQKLGHLTEKNRLIAVLFADANPDFAIITELRKSSFSGVMLDTMDKKKGALKQVMPNETIKNFVTLTKQNGLICGLAGSLKLEDIAPLLEFETDYLGFRSALCQANNRTAELDFESLKKVKQALV